MARKRKLLPKNFKELVDLGDISAIKEVFLHCELDAKVGLGGVTALGVYKIQEEIARWLVEQGADINARDKFNYTPLHKQASIGYENIATFIELGSDIHSISNSKDTPLHTAAAFHKPLAVQELLAHGANLNAKNDSWQTPLEKALAYHRGGTIENVTIVSKILIDAGSEITERMKETVKTIGEEFEFYKGHLSNESLARTTDALAHLYELFDVEPVVKPKVHDSISEINIEATEWAEQHEELWHYLVPGQGHAKTVQGEIIRITGRIHYEVMNNGGVNWDKDFKKMLDAIIQYFMIGTPLDDQLLQEANTLIKQMHKGIGDEEPARLCEMAVMWVLSNSTPIAISKPTYKR